MLRRCMSVCDTCDMTSVDDKTEVQEQMTGHVLRQAQIIADRLRSAANDVERHSREVRRNLRDLELDHARVAQEVAHDIASLMGNLNLDNLIAMAAEADRFARSGVDA